ncbi:MAG TPA: RlmE family RNA methyltransferase [Candidatus Binatia bacterium]|jgi:23S rRNA (uridine2552-2'-O)-methyltransferase
MAYERKDAFYNRAKSEGLRSRAAYKLSELQRRLRLIRSGDAVVDLGAWPGGWLQVAADLVGARGRVVGIDVTPLDPLPDARVAVLEADTADPALPARVRELLGRPADVVLSDMAPKLTGIAPRDAARAAELLETAHAFAVATLRQGGTLVTKTFGGAEMEAARAALRTTFGRVRLVGLEATRKGSSELYLVAAEFRGT